MTTAKNNSFKIGALLALFFASGFSALVYQVCWQRALFTVTGTDLESTTIIVVVFMLGLGGGAILGGQVADRWASKRVLVFAITEFIIGLYGAVSLHLISFLSAVSGGASLGLIFTKAIIVLLIPTVLMGTTLPVLVTHLYQANKNIGVSIGRLYASNTLGAGVGAIVTGFIFFKYFGLSGSVDIAVIINIIVAVVAAILFGRERAA